MSKARSISKISSNSVTSFNTRQGAVTLESTDISTTLNFSPKAVTTITSLTYSGDDLAVSTTSPLPITINGTDFESGSTVYVDTISPTNAATAISYSGTTQITCTPPAKSAASYNLWIVGPTGKLTVLANGILYSGTPNWSGQSTSLSADASSVNIQLSAAGDTPLVYSLVSGTLPTGVTLNSSGLISGTVTGLTNDTTYSNLVIRANDPQNQDASITINLTLIVQHKISRSLRFNYQADSTDLTRTFTQAGNRKTWTLSMWIKRSTLVATTPEALFGCNIASNDASWLTLWFVSNNGIRFQNWNNSYMTTNRVFRDPSAWYHIVLAVDTTQSIAANRVKFYVNGSLETYTSAITFGLNDDTLINSANVHYIGKSVVDAKGFNGYMAEIYFIDGQALTPNSFAQTDSVTGVWTPKSYTGTYGTNGFYLNFSDNSNTTAATLGKDYSGNGNNWTPNNFSVTAGAGNDSLVDTPTPYGSDTGVGGEVRGNYCTLNPLDLFGSPGVSNGNLSVAGNSGNNFVGSTFPIVSGKWYFEYTNNQATTGANNTIGLMPRTDTSPGNAKTAQDQTYSYAGFVQYAVSVTMGDSSTNALARTGTGGGLTDTNLGWKYTANDIVNVAIDFDNKKVWFGKNGTWYNSGVPASGTNATLTINSAVLAMQAYDVGYYAGTWNFGQRPFAYSAPTGYKALCTQNLPTPTIGATAATQANKYFNTVTYTGDGTSNRTITTGLQSDFVWIKRRDTVMSHLLHDVVRGAGKTLYAEQNIAEANNGSYYVQQFNSDNFLIGLHDTAINTNGATYVAWNWKANGAGSTNTAGSITSTVSANTTSGFSVVTYTGTGSAATVGHGLGAAPSMIISKARGESGSNGNWLVYHSSLGATKYLILNATDAEATNSGAWNNTAPTSSVWSIGTFTGSNSTVSPGNIAYCFAAIPGFSAFGRYTGNGSTDGPFVYCGFRPAYVMYKGSSTSGGAWDIHDDARSSSNVAVQTLFANTSGAEGGIEIDILSNGFKIRDISANANSSGVTYIYAAFAEYPFKYALAR